MEMKDFKVGKWYKNLGMRQDYYGKFFKMHNGSMYVFEYLETSIHDCNEYNYTISDQKTTAFNLTRHYSEAVEVTDINEIASHLPKSHPDLMKNQFENYEIY